MSSVMMQEPIGSSDWECVPGEQRRRVWRRNHQNNRAGRTEATYSYVARTTSSC